MARATQTTNAIVAILHLLAVLCPWRLRGSFLSPLRPDPAGNAQGRASRGVVAGLRGSTRTLNGGGSRSAGTRDHCAGVLEAHREGDRA